MLKGTLYNGNKKPNVPFSKTHNPWCDSAYICTTQGAWEAEKLKLWIRPLQILVTSGDGGLIEVVGSAVSVHQIKMNYKTLLEYFKTEFGAPTSEAFLVAQRNFAESLAGYCLFCYFVQVKDRHNSNILLDGEGHILHIDLGFMLSASNSPGGGMNFENAPFKLTNDHIEVRVSSMLRLLDCH